MSDFTDWGEQQVAAIIAGGIDTLPANLSVALLDSAAEDAFVPLQGFPRVTAPRALGTWTATQGGGTVSTGNSRLISNAIAFDFGEAPASATANAIGIYAGDNPLAYILMNAPMPINTGDSVTIGAGEVTLSLMNIGGATNYCANKLLDLIFRGQAFQFPPQYYLALFTSAPSEAGGGVEVNGVGYSRQAFQFAAPVAGVMKNPDVIQYDAPQSDWGVVDSFGLSDGAGNLLFFCALEEPRTIAQGAGAPRFLAESISLGVQ